MSRHDIVLIGYDDEERVAFVVDNDRADVQRVRYEDLARARSSTAFPEPTRHATYRIRWPERAPVWHEAVADAMQTAGWKMLGTDSELPIAVDGSEVIGASGMAALDLFATDVLRWPDQLGVDTTEIALRSVMVFVEKAGTGGGLFRRLQSTFCQEIAERFSCVAAGASAEDYRACADTWSRLAAAAVGDSTLESRLDSVTELARTLHDFEVRAVASLVETATALRASGAVPVSWHRPPGDANEP